MADLTTSTNSGQSGEGGATAVAPSPAEGQGNPVSQTQTPISGSDDFRNLINTVKSETGLTDSKAQTVGDKVVSTEETVTDESQAQDEPVVEVKEDEQAEVFETPDGKKVNPDTAKGIKDWGKGWQDTARAYETKAKFIDEKFEGDLEQAEIASDIYTSLFQAPVDQINPEEILNSLAELRPAAAEKLIGFFAGNEAIGKRAEEAVVKSLFGDGKTPEEIRQDLQSFKLWQDSGGLTNLLGESDELPEELYYDSEGNRKSDAEMELIQGILREQKQFNAERTAEKQQKAQAEQTAKTEAVNTQINDLTQTIFDPIDNVLEQLKMLPTKEDSPEVSGEKEMTSKMLGYFVMGEFFKQGSQTAALYKETVDAIRDGDKITQKRSIAKINGLVSDLVKTAVDFNSNQNKQKKAEVKERVEKITSQRKEVDGYSSNQITDPSLQRKENETLDESIERLKKAGLLSKDKFR